MHARKCIKQNVGLLSYSFVQSLPTYHTHSTVQVLSTPSITTALNIVSKEMQSQYRRRRPVQLAADVIEYGLYKKEQGQYRADEANLSFAHTWGLCMFPLCYAVLAFFTVGVTVLSIFIPACLFLFVWGMISLLRERGLAVLVWGGL